MIEQKMLPAAAVVRLVGEAMSLAEGRITDTIAVRAAIEDADELSDLIRASDPTSTYEPEIRLTTIDLRRPAPDILEDLIHGIHGCWLLWQEYNYPDRDDDDSELLEEEDPDVTAHLRSVFSDAVRAEVANLER